MEDIEARSVDSDDSDLSGFVVSDEDVESTPDVDSDIEVEDDADEFGDAVGHPLILKLCEKFDKTPADLVDLTMCVLTNDDVAGVISAGLETNLSLDEIKTKSRQLFESDRIKQLLGRPVLRNIFSNVTVDVAPKLDDVEIIVAALADPDFNAHCMSLSSNEAKVPFASLLEMASGVGFPACNVPYTRGASRRRSPEKYSDLKFDAEGAVIGKSKFSMNKLDAAIYASDEEPSATSAPESEDSDFCL